MKRSTKKSGAFAENAASAAPRTYGRRLPPTDVDGLPDDVQRALQQATVSALRTLHAVSCDAAAAPETKRQAAADVLSYAARYCSRCAQELAFYTDGAA